MKKNINLVTALTSEAKPLIEYYQLKRLPIKPFACYQAVDAKNNSRINLLVSGLGCLNMAAAVAWLAALQDGTSAAWVNIGTAGHASLDKGRIFRVHEVSGVGLFKPFYPPLVVPWKTDSHALLTVEHVVDGQYPLEQAVDMEGSAFFACATKFASAELVQSLKIISDNQQHSIETLNSQALFQLISEQISVIDEFVQSMLSLLTHNKQSSLQSHGLLDLVDEKIQHLHCTVSQRQQYHTLMDRLFVLGDDLQGQCFAQHSNMKSVLKVLQIQLNERAVQI